MKPKPFTADQLAGLPVCTWTPDPHNPGYFLYRSDRKFYYASDIPDSLIADCPKIVARESDHLAYLARPEELRYRNKWVVCIIRVPDYAPALREQDLAYILGLVDGVLLTGLLKEKP